MKQHNSYAAGRKVYGGGRSNPTSGTVNPSGYIDRAANKKASQRRSGLAKMALTRLGTGVQQPRNLITPGPNLTSPGTPDASSPTGQNYIDPSGAYNGPLTNDPSYNPVEPTGDVRQGFHGIGNPNNGPGMGGPLARDSAGNVGHISNDQFNQRQDAINWQPPVDPEAEAQAAQYEAERQRYLTDLMGQETNFRSAAGRRLRDLETQRPIAQDQLLGDFAGRGMAFSGRYLHDTGDLQNRFAQQATDVNEDLNQNLAQIASARAGKNSEIQALLNSNMAKSAARNANNPLFRAPVAPAYNFAPAGGNSEDELAIEAIKRRLAAGA